MLALFVTLRLINLYGEPAPWLIGATPLQSAMSFVNLTKYPPSADFLLLTLGTGSLLLAGLEHLPRRAIGWLTVFGSVPLFFYILHLYLLHALNLVAAAAVGQAGLLSVPNVAAMWALALGAALPCWFPCRWFGTVKRGTSRWWVKYL